MCVCVCVCVCGGGGGVEMGGRGLQEGEEGSVEFQVDIIIFRRLYDCTVTCV